jgi:hypothetical protein
VSVTVFSLSPSHQKPFFLGLASLPSTIYKLLPVGGGGEGSCCFLSPPDVCFSSPRRLLSFSFFPLLARPSSLPFLPSFTHSHPTRTQSRTRSFFISLFFLFTHPLPLFFTHPPSLPPSLISP